MSPKNRVPIWLLAPSLGLLGACVSTGGGPREKTASSPAPAARVEAAGNREAGELRRALAEAIRHPGSWSALRLAVECESEGGMRSLEVYGNGVAVWAGRRQFDLPLSEVAHLLSLLEDADFLGMEERYGGKRAADGALEEGSATMVTCRARLDLDGMKKETIQLFKGEQSAAFKRLADALLDDCEERGEAGVTAADLADGLEKVAAGELAPEVLSVVLHRRPDKRAEAGAQGFLLRISGLAATTRPFDPAAGYGDPLELELDPAELAELARALADGAPESFPANLWAEHYTDLSIRVLDRHKSVQARQFARMSPSTHGQRQVDFDSVYGLLAELHRRVLADGHPPREPRAS